VGNVVPVRPHLPSPKLSNGLRLNTLLGSTIKNYHENFCFVHAQYDFFFKLRVLPRTANSKEEVSPDADIEAYTYRIKMYSNNFYMKNIFFGVKVYGNARELQPAVWSVSVVPSTGVQHNIRFVRETKIFYLQ
jgi:hypothetical protein